MRLICPSCFAICSLEAWDNDPAARQVLDTLSRLPHQVAARTPSYLGLFRQGERGLSWKRALRLITDLQVLVAAGTVHWPGSEERPAPPDLWARVMDQMIARRFDGDPLTDHNYLRKVVHGEAKPLAVEAETRSHEETLRRRGEEPRASKPERKPRTCFTCTGFKPPRGCAEGHRPVSGNQSIGCDKWADKPSSANDLMSGLVTKLTESLQEK